jgi:hypothetical protein
VATLAAHRQRIAKAQVLAAVASFVLLAAAVLRAASLDTPGGLTPVAGAFVVGWITAVGLFVSLVFGSWKIVWFAWANPPVRRSDWAYIVIFSAWIVWTLFGAAFLLVSHSGTIQPGVYA